MIFVITQEFSDNKQDKTTANRPAEIMPKIPKLKVSGSPCKMTLR